MLGSSTVRRSVDGDVVRQSADPTTERIFGDIGQVATANGVAYAGSSDKAGSVYAMDANIGQIRWHFATAGSIASGASIFDGTVYWGSGYAQFASSGTSGNNKVYAFCPPSH
jgi:polyvinyl alcohol dehydrogenase (cytochrome)